MPLAFTHLHITLRFLLNEISSPDCYPNGPQSFVAFRTHNAAWTAW